MHAYNFCSNGPVGKVKLGHHVATPEEASSKCHEKLNRFCSTEEKGTKLSCEECAGKHWPDLARLGCDYKFINVFCGLSVNPGGEAVFVSKCSKSLKGTCAGKTPFDCENCAGMHWPALFKSGCNHEAVLSFCHPHTGA